MFNSLPVPGNLILFCFYELKYCTFLFKDFKKLCVCIWMEKIVWGGGGQKEALKLEL